jgi:hypothetical protein
VDTDSGRLRKGRFWQLHLVGDGPRRPHYTIAAGVGSTGAPVGQSPLEYDSETLKFDDERIRKEHFQYFVGGAGVAAHIAKDRAADLAFRSGLRVAPQAVSPIDLSLVAYMNLNLRHARIIPCAKRSTGGPPQKHLC